MRDFNGSADEFAFGGTTGGFTRAYWAVFRLDNDYIWEGFLYKDQTKLQRMSNERRVQGFCKCIFKFISLIFKTPVIMLSINLPLTVFVTAETRVPNAWSQNVNRRLGYEEAAAQGLISRINVATHAEGKSSNVLERESSYIRTLIDDLVTKIFESLRTLFLWSNQWNKGYEEAASQVTLKVLKRGCTFIPRTSLDESRNATGELRLLAIHNMDNRIVIAKCGDIILLIGLLRSSDEKVLLLLWYLLQNTYPSVANAIHKVGCLFDIDTSHKVNSTLNKGKEVLNISNEDKEIRACTGEMSGGEGDKEFGKDQSRISKEGVNVSIVEDTENNDSLNNDIAGSVETIENCNEVNKTVSTENVVNVEMVNE
ncbi:hypothetical protein CTI12_AA496440 [Artemisia annua]|uniref:Uncharacterized protein n=1 Tax=Artemisia annua TaxID=35608 RepID=A0A2U1LFH1_ARTAN|nr:hypothetical protein CTI12_AA496440 [Artemisia annua]